MSNSNRIAEQRLARLEERVRALAQEKSYLQLVNNLMSKLSEVPGLENTVEAILRIFIDNLGGSNVALFYGLGSKIHYADVYGERKVLGVVEDVAVREAFETRRLVEQVSDFAETKMMTPAFTKASTWALPLLFGEQLIGVLKAEGMLLTATEVRSQLEPFFGYAALVLKNEVESHIRETQAAQLAAIVQSSDDAIIGKTLEGTITSWNVGAARIYGYEAAEMIGESIVLLAPPGHEDEPPRLLARLRQGEHIEHFETVRRRKDGRDIHVSLTISPIRNDRGDIVGASTIARDITERVQAEQNLALMAFALNNVREAVFLIDASARLGYVNDEACRCLGYSRAELLALRVADIDPDFTLDRWPGHWRELRELRSITFEGRHRAKGGTIIPVEISANYFEYAGKAYNLALAHDITERKRAEAALQESERRYRRITEGITDYQYSVSVKNSHHVATAQSPACAVVTGYTVADFAADPHLWIRMVAPEDRELVRERVRQILAGKEVPPLEHRILRKDGTARWVCDTIILQKDQAGNLRGYDGVVKDITDRKAAEAERQAHIRFLESLNRVDQAIKQETDVEQMLRRAVQAVSSIFDCDRAWLLYPCAPDAPSFRVPVEITKPAFPGAQALNVDVPMSPEQAETLREALASDDPVTYTAGTERPVVTASQFGVQSQMFVPLFPKLGKPWVFGLHQCSYPRIWTNEEKRLFKEISRRISDGLSSTLYFHELQENEQRFRATFEQAAVGIAHVTPNGQWLRINQKLCDIVGYSRAELLERTFQDITHPDDREADQERVRRVLAGEMPTYSTEKRCIRKDGSMVWVNLTVSFVHLASAGPGYFISVVEDISGRKAAQEDVQRLTQELDQRVRQRTAQLEEANKELEAFAYSVSHDLRAPLRQVDGFLELLRKRTAGTLDEQSRHYMANISDSAKRMGKLIEDLLSFSRMGRQTIAQQPVSLGALAREVIRELGPETQGRAVCWRVADLPVITGDRAMLRIVLVNLISNAVKFTRPRQQAEIEIGWLPAGDTETAVFVRDNGVGFDMKYSDRLYGVFQRLHRADEFEGVGIGLATVRRIVNRHGGRTWAEGMLNQGATLWFTLPLAKPQGGQL